LASTGMRIGEALGLTWEDVDLDERTLRVRRAIQRQKGKGLVMIEPKTAKGRRTVALTPTATRALRVHRSRQLEHRLRIGNMWEEHNLIFPSEVGRPLDPNNVYHRFQRTLLSIGLPKMRLHDLRHTAATLMMAEGIPPRVVQEMLGHANIRITLDTYSHVMPTMQHEAAEKMEEAFDRARRRNA